MTLKNKIKDQQNRKPTTKKKRVVHRLTEWFRSKGRMEFIWSIQLKSEPSDGLG